MTDDERAQLSAAYAAITTDEYGRRWDLSNPGNSAALAERQEVLGELAAGRIGDRGVRVLDLGCGPLSVLPDRLSVDSRIGADLLLERLRSVRAGDGAAVLANADGARLPFRSGTFDVVLLSTLMSSVLNESTRRGIAQEAARVLQPDGVVLWYDFRLPSTTNRATRPIRRRELLGLFPDFSVEVRSLTLLPPLARRLGRQTRWAYPLLCRVPLLRSHLAACLTKRGT